MREELLYISAHKDHAHRTQERTGYVIFYFHDEEAFLASIFFFQIISLPYVVAYDRCRLKKIVMWKLMYRKN